MFYIVYHLEDFENRADQLHGGNSVDENLRGYNSKTWTPPELADLSLPMSDLSYDVCPTNRNVYLSRIEKEHLPTTKARVRGKAIEWTYFGIHRAIAEHVRDKANKKDEGTIDPWSELTNSDRCILDPVFDRLKQEFDVDAILGEKGIRVLERDLRKIIRFECHLATAVLHYHISGLKDARVAKFHADLLRFNIEPGYKADVLGFGVPATPDFVYSGKIIGDVKTGPWRQMFWLSLAGYALAYEYDVKHPMDVGIIHHVEFRESHVMPLHYETKLRPIDNALRVAFLQARDKKLLVLLNQQDPGKPDKSVCTASDCPWKEKCWPKVG